MAKEEGPFLTGSQLSFQTRFCRHGAGRDKVDRSLALAMIRLLTAQAGSQTLSPGVTKRHFYMLERGGQLRLLGPGARQPAPTINTTVAETPRLRLIPEDEESRHPEGAASYRLHRQLERDTTLAAKAKQKRLAETECLSCDVCNFDFEREYGELGAGYIEAHHTVPVSELTGGTKTQLSDLALVCSNCHRMLHRGPKLLPVEELRALRQHKE